MRDPINVAVAVIFGTGEHEGRLFYQQRPLDALRPGMWEHPGGKLERGEDVRAAAEREVLEELGCRVAIGEIIASALLDLYEYSIVLTAVQAGFLDAKPPRALLGQLGFRWASPQYAIDHMPCSPGTYLLHRAVMQWMRHGIKRSHGSVDVPLDGGVR